MHLSAENYKIIKPLMMQELLKGHVMPYEMGQMVERQEFINTGICGLIPSPDRCSPAEWPEIIQNRLKYGCNIYFANQGRDILVEKIVLPWVGTLVE